MASSPLLNFPPLSGWRCCLTSSQCWGPSGSECWGRLVHTAQSGRENSVTTHSLTAPASQFASVTEGENRHRIRAFSASTWWCLSHLGNLWSRPKLEEFTSLLFTLGTSTLLFHCQIYSMSFSLKLYSRVFFKIYFSYLVIYIKIWFVTGQ